MGVSRTIATPVIVENLYLPYFYWLTKGQVSPGVKVEEDQLQETTYYLECIQDGVSLAIAWLSE